VGYRCKQCVREQQDKFFDAQMLDYLLAAGASLVISFMMAAILARLRWFLIAFFLSPAAGAVIGSAVLLLTHKRRGRIRRWVGTRVLGAPWMLLNRVHRHLSAGGNRRGSPLPPDSLTQPRDN
jgi:hypothetical protein